MEEGDVSEGIYDDPPLHEESRDGPNVQRYHIPGRGAEHASLDEPLPVTTFFVYKYAALTMI